MYDLHGRCNYLSHASISDTKIIQILANIDIMADNLTT